MFNKSNYKQLLVHQYFSYKRSTFWKHSIVINILLVILVLYLILNLAFIGYFIDKIFAEAFPNENAVELFSKFLFYYLLFDFSFRFFAQKIPVLEVEPYLHLPIKRSKLFHFILFRSTLSLFNFLPMIVLIPFAIKVIIPEYSAEYAMLWLLMFFSFLLASNYFSFLVKKIFVQNPLRIIMLFVLLIIFVFLDAKSYVPFSKYFVAGILNISEQPIIVAGSVLLAITAYFISYTLLKKNSYLENIKDVSKKTKTGGKDISFLKSKGTVGELLNLEIKLILRNKRPRSYLMSPIFILAYGFMIYGNPHRAHNYFYLLGIGILITGTLLFQYGPLVFGWESSYFDRLLTVNTSISELFQEKYYLFSFTSLVAFVITLPFAFFNYEIALINLAALLYNLGVNIYIILFFSRFNKKRITLMKKALINYEGTNFMQFLIIFPTVGIPFLIFLLFYFLNLPLTGIAVIGGLGIVGMLLKEHLIKLVSGNYKKHKYEILSGFRQG